MLNVNFTYYPGILYLYNLKKPSLNSLVIKESVLHFWLKKFILADNLLGTTLVNFLKDDKITYTLV